MEISKVEIGKKHRLDPSILCSEFVQRRESQRDPTRANFISAIMSHFPVNDWLGRPTDDLYHAILDFHQFCRQRKKGEAIVRVYDPSLEEHGWVCGHSVVIICCQDLPFVVDSVRMVLEGHGYAIHVSKSTILEVIRDLSGDAKEMQLSSINSKNANEGDSLETFAYFEITGIPAEGERARLCDDINRSIKHVNSVVADYRAMIGKVDHAMKSLEYLRDADKTGDQSEGQRFLKWLTSSHFTFLGYRSFVYDTPLKNNAPLPSGIILKEEKDDRLGIFNAIEIECLSISTDDFVSGAQSFYESHAEVCFSKSHTRSTVHRNVYPDYVVVKNFNEDGLVIGEHRFLGFFTYSVNSMSPSEIPILRQKVDYVIERSGLSINSHDGKRLRRYIDLHPKEELFQATSEELYFSFRKILELNERDIVRLITRNDAFEQFMSCLIFVPRELYTTDLRLKIQHLLGSQIHSNEADITTFFSESKHARAHIVYRLPDNAACKTNLDYMEPEVIELALGWREHFKRALDDKFGEPSGRELFLAYINGIPQGYQETIDARSAAGDIETLDSLNADNPISMQLYRPASCSTHALKFRIAHLKTMLELSDVIPVLENLGLRVLGEQPFKISRADGCEFWLHDFELKVRSTEIPEIRKIKSKFETAFKFAWHKVTENDAFNQLVIGADLHWREINILRAYANYMKQTMFHLSVEYIAATLVSNPSTTKHLLKVFSALFDPDSTDSENERRKFADEITKTIDTELDSFKVLNEELVFRRYLDFFNATLRVNFYQKNNHDDYPAYLTVKLNPQRLEGIPEPKPAYEFYVYSARVEGVHLRTSLVARGGLRWSDRFEDYRTEVLGLVKAQQVKNAVIVPSGAKGGFVAKRIHNARNRDEFIAEGIACYKLFIRGLLDLTDNIVDGKIVKPNRVVCRDGDDAYLVVAADKGTATFSDLANEISREKNHWLGDAFASGGSQGYDHKGMGITAKGAWVSVQRHFRELGLHTQQEPFTVIGIGDMAGDVFGNGMLLSETIELVAAFNHLHIFIDPNPNPATSFLERKRLFETPRTGWSDYDAALISRGGGIFSRSEKFIPLSKEIKSRFKLTGTRLTPNQLIHALLKAEVDLIWNGGIGTYVKSEEEMHSDVGDRANDVLRVNGRELHCRVFGEGGNLGMTQLGRIEYAQNGGACNTDFIDNAAGVDCSDHEVNIKILIDAQVASGDLTEKQRNKLLASMTDDVSSLVLNNNEEQTLALSVAQYQVKARMNEYRRFISYLEGQGRLNRALEHLPQDEHIIERIGKEQFLTRPELSVLISYAKVQLKEELACGGIANDIYCAESVFNIFPMVLHEKYAKKIKKHKLHKEIIATQLANDFVNHLGITALHRMSETTGSATDDIVKAFVVSRDVFGLTEFRDHLQSLNYKISSADQYRLLGAMIRRVRRGTRWFLINRRGGVNVKSEVTAFGDRLKGVHASMKAFLTEMNKDEWEKSISSYQDLGLDKRWQTLMSMPDNLFSGLCIAEIVNVTGVTTEKSTTMFLGLMNSLKLGWFATQLSNIRVDNYWQANARESFIDDLEARLRQLSILLLKQKSEKSIDEQIEQWLSNNEVMVNRWKAMVNKVESTTRTDYAMFAVALKELNDLVQVTSEVS